jgi:O-antigen/teichoic acid export membrane protein
MARTRKALLTAAFSYGQFALSMGSTFLLLPFILRTVGARNYGLWLATGELVGYLGMTDLGVFSIMPWLIAASHGRGDLDALRRLFANGVMLGLAVGCIIVGAGLAVWWLCPGRLGLATEDVAALGGPLALVLVTAALTYPLKVFESFLTALQDAVFYGILKLVQLVLTAGLTWVLLRRGLSFHALAAAATVPPAVGSFACLARTAWVAPHLLRSWAAPSWTGILFLLKEGVGAWLGNFGVRLLAAGNGLIITFLGHPEWVPIYLGMAKGPQLLQQLCRVLPDSGMVGVAQIYGEGRTQRVREVIHCLLVLHLFLAGSSACLILAINPSFVHWWLGVDVFGGPVLNALLAMSLLVAALTHSVVTPVGVIGRRLQIGTATILNGVAYVALAVGLGPWWGLGALPAALSLSCVATSLCWALCLQRRVFQITPRMILVSWLSPWALRAALPLAIAGVIGYYLLSAPIWQAVALLAPVGMLYVLLMRPVLDTLPLPENLRMRMRRLRLGGTRTAPVPGVAAPELSAFGHDAHNEGRHAQTVG